MYLRMNLKITLRNILQIEDSVEILEICCPDTCIPIWSTIWVPFLRLVVGDLLYGVTICSGNRVLGAGSGLKLAVMILRSFKGNSSLLRTHPA
jgi:hypothetical protein